MASIPVTLVGIAYTDKSLNGHPVTIVCDLSYQGLGIGGGPMPGGPPLGIWGGGGVGNYPDAGLPGPQPGQPPRPWGPINYPDQGLPGNQPGLWPIRPPYMDIGFPGPQPGGPTHIWGGPWYPPTASTGPGFPTNPIVIPRPPVDFPTPPAEGDKPPPEGGGWGYSSEYGWGYFPMQGGKPQPGVPPATP